MPLGDILRETAERTPDAPALTAGETSVSYAELACESDCIAGRLHGLGVKKGDRVGLLLPNIPAFVSSYFGIVTAGATVVPQNIAYTPPELDYQIRDAGAAVLITSASLLEKAKQNGLLVGGLREVILIEDMQGETPGPCPAPGPGSGPGIDETEAVAAILYTSGTTGRPKGAMLTHANLLADARAAAAALECDRREVFLCVLPLFHAFAATVSMLVPVLLGARTVLMQQFNPLHILETIASQRATIFAGVPAMYAVWASADSPKMDLSSWRLAISGGAPLPVEVLKRFEERYPAIIIEGDGPTECSPVTSCNPVRGKRKAGSIGLPLDCVQMRIVDDQGRPLPPNTRGEIVVKGPTVMKGYWRNPDATAEVILHGWYHTGDIGEMDEDGYFYIVDRKKDIIIVGGANVYPREVEEVLRQHPTVQEAAVIAAGHHLRGEVVRAVIVPRPGTTPRKGELIAFCRERLAPFKVPRRIEFRDQLPKTAAGKVLKRTLREESA